MYIPPRAPSRNHARTTTTEITRGRLQTTSAQLPFLKPNQTMANIFQFYHDITLDSLFAAKYTQIRYRVIPSQIYYDGLWPMQSLHTQTCKARTTLIHLRFRRHFLRSQNGGRSRRTQRQEPQSTASVAQSCAQNHNYTHICCTMPTTERSEK